MKLKINKNNLAAIVIIIFLISLYFGTTIPAGLIFGALAIFSYIYVLKVKIYFAKYDIYYVIAIFFLCFRNGDLLHSNYGSFTKLFICYLMFIVIRSMENIEGVIIKTCLSMTIIHILLGFYFWLKPNMFLENIYPYIDLSNEFSNVLLGQIRNGYMIGLTSHYSTLGMYFAFGLILFWAYYFNSSRKKIWLPLIGILMGAFLANAKRGPFIFSILTVLCVYFCFYHRLKIKTLVNYGVVAIGIGIFCFYSSKIEFIAKFFSRFTTDTMSNSRIDTLWIPAVKIFMENPVLGAGWRNYKYLFQNYSTFNRPADAHNIYLQILCETGIVGFVFFLFLFWMITGYSYKTMKNIFRNISRETDICATFLFGIQIFFYLYGITGNPLYDLPLFLYVISVAWFCHMGDQYHVMAKKK